MDTPTFRDGSPVPTAREVRETGEIIFLMMKDQGTNDSFGTFYAWLTDHYRHLPVATVRNVWRHVICAHGGMRDDELIAFWETFRRFRTETDQRNGQALYNALWCVAPHLESLVWNTGADCFNNDAAIGPFLDTLGIPRSEARVRVAESGAA